MTFCACYTADLLLRQYKRIRNKKKKTFSYKDIKTVYAIVLFEKSEKEFHQFPNIYLHYFSQKSNTGLKLDLLQEYLFIPLDIFKKNQQNKTITNKLDAWLTFFSTDDAEDIIHLIEAYPEFRPMYQEAYEMCRNVEETMGLFSKELRELDRNTVQLMIDEMQDEIDSQRETIEGQKDTIEGQKDIIAELQKQIEELKAQHAQISSE